MDYLNELQLDVLTGVIIEKHGGSIDFISQPEPGSRFFVLLPLSHPES